MIFGQSEHAETAYGIFSAVPLVATGRNRYRVLINYPCFAGALDRIETMFAIDWYRAGPQVSAPEFLQRISIFFISRFVIYPASKYCLYCC